MPSIFISYRRSDSIDVAGRIYDSLAAHFGKDAIFKDVDNIPLGADFREYLKDTLNQCEVVLAVIGPTWVNAKDAQGRRRLDNPSDWVRVEIQEALKRKDVLAVPLLVSHASMPRVNELPDGLQDLAYRNSREARPDPDFHKDISRLIEGLERHYGQVRQASAAQKRQEAAEGRQPRFQTFEVTDRTQPKIGDRKDRSIVNQTIPQRITHLLLRFLILDRKARNRWRNLSMWQRIGDLLMRLLFVASLFLSSVGTVAGGGSVIFISVELFEWNLLFLILFGWLVVLVSRSLLIKLSA